MSATLFVALVPPPEAIAALELAVDSLRERRPELGWIPADRWHVTMCFLGRAEPSDELSARLARVAHRHEAPALQIVGGGRFGDRVLFAKLHGDLRPLATGVTRAAQRAGYQVEERPFRAHLTLARARRTKVDLRPLAAALAAVEGPAWMARELILLRGAQPSYQRLDSWTLAAPG